MPTGRASGQTDRFSSDFNPAIGGVIDNMLTWNTEEGLNPDLHAFESSLDSWIDPNTWAYAVLVGNEKEALGVEKTAVI